MQSYSFCFWVVKVISGSPTPRTASPSISELPYSPAYLSDNTGSPRVTRLSSLPYRLQTPWYDGWISNAFAPIVQARPCPIFGWPVHLQDSSYWLRSGNSPQALRIPPYGGHPALWFIHHLQTSPRGITPEFGYEPPDSRFSRTLTCLISALPRAHYKVIRLLTNLRHMLRLQNVVLPLPPCDGICQTSQVYVCYFVRSPRSIDPDGTCPASRYRLYIAACGVEEHIGFRSLLLTGLNHFTLSHCGSRTPMPTLKPNLTASAPRLSTGCSLNFAGQGISPCYITRTELAHPPFRIITRGAHSMSSIKIS